MVELNKAVDRIDIHFEIEMSAATQSLSFHKVFVNWHTEETLESKMVYRADLTLKRVIWLLIAHKRNRKNDKIPTNKLTENIAKLSKSLRNPIDPNAKSNSTRKVFGSRILGGQKIGPCLLVDAFLFSSSQKKYTGELNENIVPRNNIHVYLAVDKTSEADDAALDSILEGFDPATDILKSFPNTIHAEDNRAHDDGDKQEYQEAPVAKTETGSLGHEVNEDQNTTPLEQERALLLNPVEKAVIPSTEATTMKSVAANDSGAFTEQRIEDSTVTLTGSDRSSPKSELREIPRLSAKFVGERLAALNGTTSPPANERLGTLNFASTNASKESRSVKNLWLGIGVSFVVLTIIALLTNLNRSSLPTIDSRVDNAARLIRDAKSRLAISEIIRREPTLRGRDEQLIRAYFDDQAIITVVSRLEGFAPEYGGVWKGFVPQPNLSGTVAEYYRAGDYRFVPSIEYIKPDIEITFSDSGNMALVYTTSEVRVVPLGGYEQFYEQIWLFKCNVDHLGEDWRIVEFHGGLTHQQALSKFAEIENILKKPSVYDSTSIEERFSDRLREASATMGRWEPAWKEKGVLADDESSDQIWWLQKDVPRNFDLTVRLQGEWDLGLVFRGNIETNRYLKFVCGYRGEMEEFGSELTRVQGSDSIVMKDPAGIKTIKFGGGVENENGENKLRVIVRGANIKCELNDVLLFDVIDRDPISGRSVGLFWDSLNSDEMVFIRDFSVIDENGKVFVSIDHIDKPK